MDAFHIFWSKPNILRSLGKLDIPVFERLVWILSALTWKKNNGPIRLATDSAGKEWLFQNGLSALYDEISTELDNMPNLNPSLFWAAGKLWALKTRSLPCVILDTDMVIWKKLDAFWGKNITVSHFERINSAAYPDLRSSPFCSACEFPEEWDWTISPANTSFLYFPAEAAEIREKYVRQAFSFMNAVAPQASDPVKFMCFAEQRLLTMCSEAAGMEVKSLLDFEHLEEQNIATHLWGYKRILKSDPAECDAFCRRCIKRIQSDFPSFEICCF